jgi:sulfatase modifying factor 1
VTGVQTCALPICNVWEWVADWYDANYYKNSPAQNPTGPTSGQYHVVRGGSLYSNATAVRAAHRAYPVVYWTNDAGFRCVE